MEPQLNIYNQEKQENPENQNLLQISNFKEADIQIFDFENYKIRTLIDEYGEPWFLAKDVAYTLAYRKASDAIRILAEYEKGAHIMHTKGGPQKLAIVNESGLYSLIFASRKPEAKKFKK